MGRELARVLPVLVAGGGESRGRLAKLWAYDVDSGRDFWIFDESYAFEVDDAEMDESWPFFEGPKDDMSERTAERRKSATCDDVTTPEHTRNRRLSYSPRDRTMMSVVRFCSTREGE